jgi:superfamily II DNA/RNA helicase
MLDLGFSKELGQINKAADHRKRQTLLFSATLDHAQVNEFASELLRKPKRIAIEAGHTEHVDITKRFYLADNLTQKEALLHHFLATEKSQQIIIFTATRSDTDRLAKLLTDTDLNAVALSGELNQGQRNQIMESFAKGKHKILVTTDLASRGLDLINVSHVINFDMPKHTEEFVHRIGRTGRAGTKGDAISLVGPNDWLSFKNVEAFLQQKISFTKVDGIKVKFKGLKPKKAKVVKAKTNTVKSTRPADTRPRKVIKKTFLDNDDAGAMKIIKRKKPLTPEQIEDATKKEQD